MGNGGVRWPAGGLSLVPVWGSMAGGWVAFGHGGWVEFGQRRWVEFGHGGALWRAAGLSLVRWGSMAGG